MRRRDFITLLGASAAAWPLAAQAQQSERVRRIGVFMNIAAEDPESQARVAAFAQALQELGWTIGRNLRIEYRWIAGDAADRNRIYAEELVALAPDVVLASGGRALSPLQQATHSVPIVFAAVPDPVAAGFVDSLARPGGNVTGFAAFEYSISGKWLELLKQIAPQVTRVAVIRTPTIGGGAQFGAIQGAAPSFGVEVTPVDARDAGEIERRLSAFVRGPTDGLIVTVNALTTLHRGRIIALAARLRLPAVYHFRYFVTGGGLISYGPDPIDQFRRAAGYVDRILRGEKPADLPVQTPVKYETVLNLKTAKALGLDVPATVLVRADEVIE